MKRRQFLLVCTAAAVGLWTKPTGLTTLSKKIVLALSGSCSFCGVTAQEYAMARVVGREMRICHSCVGLCVDILHECGLDQRHNRHLGPEERAAIIATQDRLESEEMIKDLLKIKEALDGGEYEREIDKMIQNARDRLDGTAKSHRDTFHKNLFCSFCDTPGEQTKKLIAGPMVYICDECIHEAAIAVNYFAPPRPLIDDEPLIDSRQQLINS
jgi:hypothetical protein